MRKVGLLLLVLICLLGFKISQAQSRQIYMNRDFEWKYQDYLSKKDVGAHDAIKPFVSSDFSKGVRKDSIENYVPGFPFKKMDDSKPHGNGRLMIYPLMDLGITMESGDTSAAYSRIGIGAGGLFEYKDNIAIQVNASGHRASYPSHTVDGINRQNIVPEGHVWHTNTNGYNYVDLNGYFSWNATDFLNIQVGRGNHFLGNGYRSLLLSDNSGNYNYGRAAVDIWRFKYVVIYGHMKDMNNNASLKGSEFRDKFSTIHYLSWNVSKWFNIGFFESVVWKASDTLLNRGYDVNYINPVIFFRPVEYSTGSSDNSIMGLNFSIKPKSGWQIYGQFMIDEFLLSEFSKDMKELIKPGSQTQTGWWANKYGWQLGTKAFNLFGVKRLGIQSEVNLVRPFTFSHASSVQNFGHENSPLAHPLGANFIEMTNFLNYRIKNWFIEGSVKYAYQGLSTDSLNAGEDIFRSYSQRNNEYGHYVGQGIQSHVASIGLRSSYLIYPENNLRLNIGTQYRMERVQGVERNSMFFHIGISTSFKIAFFNI